MTNMITDLDSSIADPTTTAITPDDALTSTAFIAATNLTLIGSTVVSIVDLAQGSEEILSAFASRTQFHLLDYVVILSYFTTLIGVGLWSSCKSESQSVSGYFLASRQMHWLPVGASLFASNIGSGHFIGLAGAGANSGITVATFEFNAMYILVLLGWLFVPVYTASGVCTMPEYLRRRFGGKRIRVYLSVLSLVMYIFTKISADLYAGAIFIKQSLNLDLMSSVSVLLFISAMFSIGGGLTAVMWTDFVQTSIMLLGSLLLAWLSLNNVGGYKNLMTNFETRSQPSNPEQLVSYHCVSSVTYSNETELSSNNMSCTSCSKMNPYYGHLLRPASDPELPWPGVLGLTILAIWYWCTDQVIVQRVLSSKSVSHAKAGCLLAALLKISTFFLIVLPGMAARMLWPNELGCSNPSACRTICGSESGCSNIAYPLLVLRLMPIGATGLMMSVMMAALISSLSSIFNSASTIFTLDVYSHFRKKTTELEQIVISRVFVICLVLVSVLWIPVIDSFAGSHFFHYIQSVTSYLAPPVCAVFVMAVFCSRINESGAFWSLTIGLGIGLLRFSADFLYPKVKCGIDSPSLGLHPFVKIHYLYFSIILFIFTCLVATIISLFTKPIDIQHLYRLTYWTKFSEQIRVDIDTTTSHNNNKNKNKIDDLKKGKDIVVGQFPAPLKMDISNETTTTTSNAIIRMLCCMTNNHQSRQYDINAEQQDKEKDNNTIANRKTIAPPPLTASEMAIIEASAAHDDPQWAPWLNLAAIMVIAIASYIFGFLA